MEQYIWLLEYYEEIEQEDFDCERYHLLGIFRTKEEAEEKKQSILKEKNLGDNTLRVTEDTILVSAADVGKSQWEGGFFTV